ncbi:2-amino-4-hydroxy-6-hydroxymethyldihydropteridine pyrophosphokinase [Roseivivax halodurans JCM 10272]|uniref:2-amino-4-hydroxy-6-hydroxymethyldihydropteridine pyrophosphokinase n=1 Tax=Roseivivax halodurans JCM 10272 TaxID=1449350 RepID=X7EIL5_9RHOB|nr:2-amino-4-hydroxy-6-hydroxymethyldihydropteridine pyrophosphokinase [Roseivivax halodurans JCM 10272]
MDCAEQDTLVALGGNWPSDAGPPEATLRAALGALAEAGLAVRRVSRFFANPCFPKGNGPDYVNAAAALAPGPGGVDPEEVLRRLHSVEARFGRVREERWGGRALDLDLLAVGEIVLPDLAEQANWRRLPLERQMQEAPRELVLPHPRMQERAFVLVPLLDIAPGWRHPTIGATVSEMCAALPRDARTEVVPI